MFCEELHIARSHSSSNQLNIAIAIGFHCIDVRERIDGLAKSRGGLFVFEVAHQTSQTLVVRRPSLSMDLRAKHVSLIPDILLFGEM